MTEPFPFCTPTVASVVCVVVTFNPEQDRFARLLAAVQAQVTQIVVVDNGSEAHTASATKKLVDAHRAHWIPLDSNKGIACAFNVGITHALSTGCDFVLQLDHDSIPAPDMVSHLLAAAAAVGPLQRIAAIGPQYLDDRQKNPPPFIRIEGMRVVRCQCEETNSVVPVDYLISSGSLIPADTWRHVGGMAEQLFIDYVDIEWGLRAGRLGFQCFGACAAHMSHSLGDTPIKFLGKVLPLHSPLRHYYHVRNAVWLYLNADLPLRWKLVDGWRLLLKYGFYSLFARPRWQHFSMMTLGIWHGLRGRLGSLQQAKT